MLPKYKPSRLTSDIDTILIVHKRIPALKESDVMAVSRVHVGGINAALTPMLIAESGLQLPDPTAGNAVVGSFAALALSCVGGAGQDEGEGGEEELHVAKLR